MLSPTSALLILLGVLGLVCAQAKSEAVRAAPVATRAAVAGTATKAAAATAAGAAAAAGNSPKPLTRQRFAWPYTGPNKVDTFTGGRGPQAGDNDCGNGKTFNSTSLCIVSHINDITDFCIWAPPKSNSSISDTEGEEVAWCTKPGTGTRGIPTGALTGVQFLKTPRYATIAGFIDQTKVNIADGDTGGELDPHGADNRGNPIGGLMYSTAFSTNGAYEQIIEWMSYIGSGRFCQKICAPNSANATSDCEHKLDRLGCDYVMPLNYAAIQGTYTSCQADIGLGPGIYVGTDSITSTYTQPGETVPITSLPYTPLLPSSSLCTTLQSAQIFNGLAASVPTSAASSASIGGNVVVAVASAATSASASPSSTVKGAAMRSTPVGPPVFFVGMFALAAMLL